MSNVSRAALLVAVAACGRHESAAIIPAAPSAGSVPLALPSSSASAAPAADESDVGVSEWQDAIRLGRWDLALRLIQALPKETADTPPLKLVRARIALERADYAQAASLLDGLDRDLPTLTDLVAKMRARAEIEVGPFEHAGEFFLRGQGASSWLKAARAFEKAGDSRARVAVERVLGGTNHDTALMAEARALRLRITQDADATSAADARWLATVGAGTHAVPDSIALLMKTDAPHPLLAEELLVRAKSLGEAGKLEEAARAVDQSARAPEANKVSAQQRLHAKGMILYRARSHEGEASVFLSLCAKERGTLSAECAFHAARALSRADRDPEAIRAYADVVRNYAATPWGEQAAFYGPYLRMLHGEWRAAATGFDAYLKVSPSGAERHDAKRFRGLCHLLSHEYKLARRELENASADESDPVSAARISNLAALAALGDGDRVHAAALWANAVREVPLTWPSLVARARLAKIGATVPPFFDAAPSQVPPAHLDVPLPKAVQFLHRLGLDDEAESALHERESAVLTAAGGRNAEALCTAYGELGRAERRYQASHQVPSALLASPIVDANRWAWNCVYPSPYAEIVQAAEKSEGLPTGLIYAVMRQESAYHPEAVSGAHAIGLLQLVSDTAARTARSLGLPADDARLTSPPYNIRVGARHLQGLVRRFAGDVPFAVGAYNAGVEPLERWLSRSAGLELDTFVERIPYKETQDYIVRVIGNWAHYAYISGGEGAVPALDLTLPSPPK